MRFKTNKLLSVLLTLAIVFSLFALIQFTAYAGNDYTVNSGPGGDEDIILGQLKSSMSGNSMIETGYKVYFGKYPQTQLGKVGSYTPVGTLGIDYAIYPNFRDNDAEYYYALEGIEWRVLKSAGGELFLLSEKALECHPYYIELANMTWENSTMRAWLNGRTAPVSNPYGDGGFIDRAFNNREQSAINTTSVLNPNNPTYGTPGGNATEDKIFLLSLGEATNTEYGFTGSNASTALRKAPMTAYARNTGTGYNNDFGFWWLRSPGSSSSTAVYIDFNGAIDPSGNSVGIDPIAARPAFNLSLASVVFTSASVGGKSLASVGGELLPAQTDEKSLKLTLVDNELKLGSLTTTGRTGDRVDFSYTGATAGKTLSAVVLSQSGALKYYGKLAENIAASGSASLILPEGLPPSDTVQIFVEEANGNYLTDFASAFVQLELEKHSVTFYVAGGNGTLTAKVGDTPITSGQQADRNSFIEFTATPNSGYQLKGWTLNGYPAIGWTLTPGVSLARDITVTVEFEPIQSTKYNYTVTLAAADTAGVGQTIFVDMMLKGNINYTQIMADINFDATLLAYAGYEGLQGVIGTCVQTAPNKITLRSVPSTNMVLGASCTSEQRIVRLKFTALGGFGGASATATVSLATVTVSAPAGFIGATTAPVAPKKITLFK